ncbi:lysine transporter LysE [Chromobacterium phragmitis]|uniref:LysE family transporter n=1 Tax=Chromobacterium phragmitis TaxID=2202141 RepID=A0A344UFA6_9NEIS|nr:LysE family transporter [Chromobacterium phragmitis]AXE28630.1 lysine transporter LysE [Chromobacterium phragmitis]AXE33954.1 lysine transporter LysE [Chromobacterium phragmitis]
MTWTIWLQFAGVCMLGAMSPGPSLAMVLQQTARGGRAGGLAAAAGHALGVGLYALAAAKGLALVMAAYPLLFRIVACLGAAYLVWLGVQGLRAAARPRAASGAAAAAAAPTSSWKAARTGLAVALSNPHLAVMFVALLSQFVTVDMPVSGQLLLIGTAIGLDFGWYALLTLLISRPAILTGLHRKARWIDGCGGALMLLLGLRILVV